MKRRQCFRRQAPKASTAASKTQQIVRVRSRSFSMTLWAKGMIGVTNDGRYVKALGKTSFTINDRLFRSNNGNFHDEILL